MNLGIITGQLDNLNKSEQYKKLPFADIHFFDLKDISNVEELSMTDGLLIYKRQHLSIKDICQWLLSSSSLKVPTWIISAEAEIEERIVYLQMGACGIIEGNYSLEEILMLVKNTLDIKSKIKNNIQDNEHIHLDFMSFSLAIGNKKIYLTKNEYKIVEFLFQHKGETCTYEQISDILRNNNAKQKNIIDQSIEKTRLSNYIFRIREKLIRVDRHYESIIHTVRSKGYMFSNEVEIS